MLQIIRVRKDSSTSRVAGAIAKAWRAGHEVHLCAVGVEATSAVVRAVAYANQYLRETKDAPILIEPRLEKIEIEGQERTATICEVFHHCHHLDEEKGGGGEHEWIIDQRPGSPAAPGGADGQAQSLYH